MKGTVLFFLKNSSDPPAARKEGVCPGTSWTTFKAPPCLIRTKKEPLEHSLSGSSHHKALKSTREEWDVQ